MNEEIGGAVVAGEVARITAITNPRNVFGSRLEFPKLSSLGTIANDEQMKLIRTALLQNFECRRQSCRVLLFRQTADVKKEFFLCIETKRAARCFLLGGVGTKDIRINTETQDPPVMHSPIAQHSRKPL